jgi:hypothetical protein
MARRRRVRGDRSFRKILKRLPETIKAEMLEMLDKTGDAVLAQQQRDVAVRTGALRSALSKRLYKGLVRVRVGLIGPAVNRRLFYARWIERGRKSKTMIARKKGPKRENLAGIYRRRIGPMPKRPFIMSDRTKRIRDTMAGQIQGYWSRVLQKASVGANDD